MFNDRKKSLGNSLKKTDKKDSGSYKDYKRNDNKKAADSPYNKGAFAGPKRDKKPTGDKKDYKNVRSERPLQSSDKKSFKTSEHKKPFNPRAAKYEEDKAPVRKSYPAKGESNFVKRDKKEFTPSRSFNKFSKDKPNSSSASDNRSANDRPSRFKSDDSSFSKRTSFRDEKPVRESRNKPSDNNRPSRFKADDKSFGKKASFRDDKPVRESRGNASENEKPSRFKSDNNSFSKRTNSSTDKPYKSFDKEKKYSKSTEPNDFKSKRSFNQNNSETRSESRFEPQFNNSSENEITDSDTAYAERNFGPKKTKSNKPASKKTVNDEGLLRLNKYISNSGICSRRDADELITQGLVSVNDKVITELGYKVNPTDSVKYDGRLLKPEKMAYVLLNKPKDFITTMDDPEQRKTVMDLIKNACKERVYPVGRLDRNTTGLLLLTNDGELSELLTHPSHEISKIYQVDLDRPITDVDFNKILNGVHLEDGIVQVINIDIVSPDKKVIGIEIAEGRNRIVRRLFEALTYEVVRLDRVSYAGLTKKDLPRGTWRLLREKEVARLKLGKSNF